MEKNHAIITNDIRRLLNLQWLAAALSIASALVAEYGFHLIPCELCLYQRIPFYAILAAVPVGYGLKKYRLTAIIAAICFLITACIAAFHTGVEYGWWQGLSTCGNKLNEANSIEELRAMLQNAPRARCDEAPFHFLGLSMAGWNVLWSFMLAMFSCYWLRKKA
jgi:disulfide bond formation protein DsbB